MKKIISTSLAALLAVSALSTAAFADDTESTATGIVAVPTIKVTVPTTLSFVFNPYGLTVSSAGKVTTEEIKDAEDNVLNKEVIVPSYIFDEATKDKGWEITNESGAVLKAGIYAYSATGVDAEGALDETKPFAVVNTINAAKAVRQLQPAITAAGYDETYTAVPFQQKTYDTTEGNTIWKEAKKTSPTGLIVDQFTEAKPLYIKMTGTVSTGKDDTSWASTDVPTIKFLFAFDFGNQTLA